MPWIWASLLKGLAIWRSRASIWARSTAGSSSASSVRPFIFATSSSRVSATTKSAPWRLNASTGRGAPLPSRRSRRTALRSPLVRSGFCSEPDSANSFSIIRWVRTNHEWSYGAMSSVVRRCLSVPRVS